LTNVCYTAVMLRDPNGVPICERAVLSAPESKTALNNLGLAYAARGDFMRAREQFVKAGDAAADYNMGIVYMATRQYQRAVESFDAALLADPRSTLVAARARQARAHAARDGN
jgi:tetratricopeptide (TPR) repeat protein